MRVLGGVRPGPADLMTLGNAACGATAILVVVSYAGRAPEALDGSGLRAVALLLLAGTVFDSLDGAFARRGGGTELGGVLDSLADAMTFGLAPAVLLAELALRDANRVGSAAILLGFLVYVCAALLRLADFSSCRHGESRFTGLPTPLGAALALSLAFLTIQPAVVAPGLAVIGMLMVSRLHYPMQRGPVVAAAALAWAFGIAGTLGVYDVRICAVVMIVVVGVLLPALPTMQARTPSTHPVG